MPRYDPERHRRRSIRLRGYDYTQPGAYFVTICTYEGEHVFGTVADGRMDLNACGQIVVQEWQRTARVRRNVVLDAFVVMPNHVHGIITLTDPHCGRDTAVGATRRVAPSPHPQPSGPTPNSLGAIIGQFKSAITRCINLLWGTSGNTVWQRNYYEHIVRDERELQIIRAYIRNNPTRWPDDPENRPATPDRSTR